MSSGSTFLVSIIVINKINFLTVCMLAFVNIQISIHYKLSVNEFRTGKANHNISFKCFTVNLNECRIGILNFTSVLYEVKPMPPLLVNPSLLIPCFTIN